MEDGKTFDKEKLNPLQQASVELIQTDLRFLYTLVINIENIMPTFWIELSPYTGLIIDGAEDWVKAYNNSSRNKINIPLFNREEEKYYEAMRNASKVWGYNLPEYYDLLDMRYKESDEYFGGLCKKIAKVFHMYDNIGVFLIDGHCCGNTIVDACYIPEYRLSESNGERIKKMAEVAGRYIAAFGIRTGYTIRPQQYGYKDYGGFTKLPFGEEFSSKHVLFACLCSINFVLYGVEELIIEEVPTKLRIEYICYYYMQNILSQVYDRHGINFMMSDRYILQKFRNSLAHYKMGVALKKDELIPSDPLWGLTQRFFQTEYYPFKESIVKELKNTAERIAAYLCVD